MKYKKYSYIVVLLLVLLVGTGRIYAIENRQITTLSNQSMVQSENDNQHKENHIVTLSNESTMSTEEKCDKLFGEKSNPDSIRSLVDEILMYPKIIVPILVIGLGTVDLGKAVISSKPDEMKKAQTTFIKRLIVGIAIFFVPVILDVFMIVADLVWEGLEMCGI